MNDLKIYKKAAQKVKASLLLFYVLLLALILGSWFLLNIDLFALPGNGFEGIVLVIALLQAFVFGALFLYLSKGEKPARILFWLAAVCNLLLLYFPITRYLQTREGIYTWLAWAACLVIEDVLLYNVGTYLFTNHSCKIYFDHVIEIDEDDDWAYEYDYEQQQAAASPYQTPPVPSSNAQQSTQNTSVYSQSVQQPAPERKPAKKLSQKARMQRLSVRLGIVVYGEMILFPIIVGTFSDYFASTDLKSVFASRDIFMLCIASSFIWTIAIFFLYYASAQSKRIVLLCFALEIGVNIWYIPRFISYYTSINPTYPLSVFIFFGILDLIRYALIILCVSPVFESSSSKI
jgi:hypothetical protein